MPIVGILVGKLDARYLVMLGFLITSSALLMMHSLYLGVDFWYLAGLRMFQASGLAFLFVPINTLSYNNIPRNKNNDVSGLTNLARNIGGSTGTAFVTTMLARQMQRHQNVLAQHMNAGDAGYSNSLNQLKMFFGNIVGGGSGFTGPVAQAYIYGQMQRQTGMLAYLDIIIVLATVTAIMVPMPLLMQKMKRGGEAPMAH
jgi:DHA2 family multidrug resistance protein